MSKRKDRKRYSNGSRQDFTKGGRVGYREGDEVEERNARADESQQAAYQEYLNSFNNDTTNTDEKVTPSQMVRPTTAGQERTERIADTAQTIQQSAQGVVPESAVIPDAVKVGGMQRDSAGDLILDEKGNPIPVVADSVVTQMTALTPEQKAEAATVTITGEDSDLKPEVVDTVTAEEMGTASGPEEPIVAGTFTGDQVGVNAQVDAAQGKISENAIAQAAGVERIDPTEAATIDIPEGALTERVVGTLSEGAKSTAVVNVGSSLSRITRAKKQLTNAGLSEADIAELGNDPEALEARLADFSEEQRGIIEGLPQEALVSNQLDTLLSGIEEGEIPIWARPAVSQVEQMLAQRGMSASTVGRDSLLNAIIQSAMPMAQANAQAIQASVGQQRAIEAQEAEANAARGQQTALANAQNVFQMDMAQFSSDQQIALSNSKFLQTVGITDATMEQQAIIQDAALMSQANLTEADFNQKAQIQNAQAFLQMDLTNLSNEQQANVLKAQQNQQRLLSNQASTNASLQFNAASQNQTNQFMANLNAQISQYNASQKNAMAQFNSTQKNAAAARDAQRVADVAKFNAQLVTQVDQFNSQQDFARNQWNAQNAAAVEASNVQWRRQANTVNTAAQNQINMQNAQNAYGLSAQAQSFLWQELRDQADFDFRAFENEENRKAQIISTAMANEGKSGQVYDDYLTNLLSSVSNSFSGGYTGSYVNFTGGGDR
jgi:CRISPR/Cas system CSM-associated protein Csm2 small subunit